MRTSRFLTLIILFTLVSIDASGGKTAKNLRELSGAMNLDGVAGYAEGLTRQGISKLISKEGSDWLCDSFAEAVNKKRRGESGGGLFSILKQNEEMKAAVREGIRRRVREALPNAVKQMIAEGLFQAAGDSAGEAYEIAEKAARFLTDPMNDSVDRLADTLYAQGLAALEEKFPQNSFMSFSDMKDLRGALAEKFSGSYLGDALAASVSGAIGDSTANAIKERITDALSGELPPELISALNKGPDEFDKFVDGAKGYMPGAKFAELKDSLLSRAVVKIPTPAYAAVLAASAAVHFAKAFAGAYVDPHELKRGCEVVRVMAWQLRNKKALNLNVMQLASFSREIAGLAGFGGAFEGIAANVSTSLDEIEKLSQEIDGLLLKPLNEVSSGLRDASTKISGKLGEVQNVLTAPLRRFADGVGEGLRDAGTRISDVLPDKFNGIPSDLDDLKEAVGIGGKLLGDAGEKSAFDAVIDATDSRDVINKIKADAGEVADSIAEAAADIATGALYGAHVLGPVAAIIGAERVPDIMPTESSELDPVMLHSGEYYSSVTDLSIALGDRQLKFARLYRSRSDFTGEFGKKWTHSFAERVLPWNGGYTHVDELGRKHFYSDAGSLLIAESPYIPELTRHKDGYELNYVDGAVKSFSKTGLLLGICSGQGECVRLEYEGTLVSKIIDSYGRAFKIERREDGMITSVTDFAGRRVLYRYNEFDELAFAYAGGISGDKDSAPVSSYMYDSHSSGSKHLLSTIIDAKGNAFLRNEYDELGRVNAQQYGSNAWTRIDYSPANCSSDRCVMVTGARGARHLFKYDGEGRLLTEQKLLKDGSVDLVVNEYDESSRLVKSCAKGDGCRHYKYGSGSAGPYPSSVEQESESGVAAEKYEFNAKWGVPEKIIQNDGSVFVMEYDADHTGEPARVFAENDSGGRELIASVERNSCGRVSRRTQYDGLSEKYDYFSSADPMGRAGNVAFKNNDGCGYLRSTVRSDESGKRRMEYEYDDAGNLRRIKEDEKKTVEFISTGKNRLVLERRSGGLPIFYSYDANDNIAEISVGGENDRIFSLVLKRGSLDRLESRSLNIKGAPEAVTRYFYDEFGYLVRISHPDGSEDSFERDDEGDVVCEVLGSNSIDMMRVCGSRGMRREFFTRAGLDQDSITLKALGDVEAGASTSNLVLDVVGRPVQAGSSSEKVKYEWDQMGRLASVLLRQGIVSFAYDGAGRLFAEHYPDKTSRTYAYGDDGLVSGVVERDGSAILVERDVRGSVVKRRAVSSGEFATEVLQQFFYDERGRLISASNENTSKELKSPSSYKTNVKFSYDDDFRVVEDSIDDLPVFKSYAEGEKGFSVSLGENPAMNFTFGKGRIMQVDSMGEVLSKISYDAKRRRVNALLGRELYYERSLDANGRDAAKYYYRGAGTELLRFEYYRNDDGDIGSMTLPDRLSRKVVRDEGGRLSEVFEKTAGRKNELRYERDERGFVKSDEPFELDPAGRIVSIGENKFFYDALGRLSAVHRGDSTLAEYRYDALGRLAYVVHDGAAEKLLWDGWRLAGKSLRDGSFIQYAQEGALGAPLLSVSWGKNGSGDVNYFATDPAGSVYAVLDSDGIEISKVRYTPLGEFNGGAEDMFFCFAGHLCDARTKLVYARNRFMAPSLGAFLTPDPLGYKITQRSSNAIVLSPGQSYHRLQGQSDRASFAFAPMVTDEAMPQPVLSRAFLARSAIFTGEDSLYTFAGGDPTKFFDPLGLASLVYDRSDGLMSLYDGSGNFVTSYLASNRTTNPNGDPLQIGSNGPFPNGTFTFGPPEFYSEKYRNDFYRRFSLGAVERGESIMSGNAWAANSGDTDDYSLSFGRIRFRVGAPSSYPDATAWRRQLFVHGGRHSYSSRTRGCIRADDWELETLAANFIAFKRQGDEIESLQVRD